MKKEEMNRARFDLQKRNREICKLMLSTMDPNAGISQSKAAEIMETAEKELENVREQHSTLWKKQPFFRETKNPEAESIGFASVLKDSIKQASTMHKRQSKPIRFHIYH